MVLLQLLLGYRRLLYADFDQDVTAVFAQPFLLCASVDGKVRRHVPDYLILREGNVPLVVDVKPQHVLTRPTVASSLGWAREVVVSRRWDFERFTLAAIAGAALLLASAATRLLPAVCLGTNDDMPGPACSRWYAALTS